MRVQGFPGRAENPLVKLKPSRLPLRPSRALRPPLDPAHARPRPKCWPSPSSTRGPIGRSCGPPLPPQTYQKLAVAKVPCNNPWACCRRLTALFAILTAVGRVRSQDILIRCSIRPARAYQASFLPPAGCPVVGQRGPANSVAQLPHLGHQRGAPYRAACRLVAERPQSRSRRPLTAGIAGERDAPLAGKQL